MTELLVNF